MNITITLADVIRFMNTRLGRKVAYAVFTVLLEEMRPKAEKVELRITGFGRK